MYFFVKKCNRFEAIVPNGTAVQNARTSYLGDTLCRDVYCHLTNDLGRYIAGLTMVGALTGADLTKVTYSPNLSDYNRKLAIESAMNALKTPFSITNSKYTEEESKDLTNYTKIDWQPTVSAYWHSTASLELISGVDIAPNYIASKKFSREELPVGTIIEIKAGYQYRADGWTSNALLPSNLRPGNISTKYVEITEEWWGDFIYRGFNISSTSGGSIVNKADEAIAAFNIYIPNK